jgi:glutamate-1-semialdehyde 2,1-aminomutase
MSKIAPLGEVYQAGTLSGNPLAMAAGLATLAVLNDNPLIYKQLEVKTEQLKIGIGKALLKKGIPFRINQIGSMISVHFCESDVVDFTTASLGNNDTFRRLFHHMLKQGVYLPPSPFESWFVSYSLSAEDVQYTVDCFSSFEG